VVADARMPLRPFLGFGAGYIRRALDQLPRQGQSAPWLTSMNYAGDVKLLRELPVEDAQLRLSTAAAERAAAEQAAGQAAATADHGEDVGKGVGDGAGVAAVGAADGAADDAVPTRTAV
jgi:hypothetical protein